MFRTHRGQRRLLLATAGFAALAFGAAAQAAEPPPRTSTVTEVIVTAQKREERLQDVPVSVTVLGGEQMREMNINSGTEIARQTPNLRVSNLGNEDQPKFSMRGVATPDFNLNSNSPTGIFYDEVFVASQFLGGPQIFDLERVEVLRGPQGTLYGKNTTGGAVNFITKKPVFASEGDLSLQAGNNSYFHGNGAINVPLIDDKLALRVAFNASRSNGWVKNLNPNGRDLSSIDNHAIRVSLRYRPTDDFDATLRLFTERANPTNIGVTNVGLGPGGTNAFGVNPRVNPITGAPFGPWEDYSNRTDGEIRVKGDGATLTMDKQFGDYTVTSITSYVKGFFLNKVDGDASIAPLLAIDFYATTQEQSQDLRISSHGTGPFNFIAGVYYGHDITIIRTDWNFFAGAITRFQNYDQTRTSTAVYADGTYDLTKADSLYAGVRWTHDKGNISNFSVTGTGAPGIPTQPAKSYDDSAPTGRIGVRHRFSDDIMGYAQYSRGYRSSAINGSALFNPADINVSQPEHLDAFEVGLKSQLFDRRLTLNSSAFYYKYKDQQFINTVSIGQSNVINAGAATLYGLEIEAIAQITPEFTVSAGASLLHTEYTDLTLDATCPNSTLFPSTPPCVTGTLIVQNLKGHQLIEAPKESFNISADYVLPLPGDANLRFHGDANQVGKQFYTVQNDDISSTKAHWEANGRIAYQRGAYELAIWGKNLNNNHVPAGIVGADRVTFLQTFIVPPYPRRYGVEIDYRF
ncbi:MAG: TonB-dependent receptor [Phenylobacterium sp.]|jgi:iron complex outermembrane receptor protein|nr:TonB-dependent receptor [Phenylobacterium sp.]